MDKFGVMLFLLKEYNEFGVIYPKSAKEISIEVELALSETYLTLEVLQQDGLIWRVGRKNLYRYGIKEKVLAQLNKLYLCLINGKQLPPEMLIDYQKLDEVAENYEKNFDIEKQEELLMKAIKELLSQLVFIEENVRFELIDSAVDEIVEVCSPDNLDEKFEQFLEDKLESIWEYIIGARLVEG